MPESYVRGVGIHKTFNRAINIHNTHKILVEHVVIYNIMGGALFLEDGIEMENIFQVHSFLLFTEKGLRPLSSKGRHGMSGFTT